MNSTRVQAADQFRQKAGADDMVKTNAIDTKLKPNKKQETATNNLSVDSIEAFRRNSGRNYDKMMGERHAVRRQGLPDWREACNICGSVGHYARECRLSRRT